MMPIGSCERAFVIIEETNVSWEYKSLGLKLTTIGKKLHRGGGGGGALLKKFTSREYSMRQYDAFIQSLNKNDSNHQHTLVTKHN